MDVLVHLITAYGIWVVFASVLVDQVGIPVPAYPLVIAAAGLATERDASVMPILGAAVVASVLADSLWFVGGRQLGARLVRLVCRLSISPDSCVLTTRRAYARWGPASLLVAKFIPGFAAVATALAGESRVRPRAFLLFDALGALLWAGLAVTLGVLFHDAVDDVVNELESLGHEAVLVLLALIAVFIAWKWWRRRMLIAQLRMTRIGPAELRQLLDEGSSIMILDVRPESLRRETGWLPGAVFVDQPDVAPAAHGTPVIVYCDCPNELSAAVVARDLQRRGFRDVRPLAGGFEDWRAMGHPVELPA